MSTFWGWWSLDLGEPAFPPLSMAYDVMSDEAMIQHMHVEIAIGKKVINIDSSKDGVVERDQDIPEPSVWWSSLNIETRPMNSDDRDFYLEQGRNLDYPWMYVVHFETYISHQMNAGIILLSSALHWPLYHNKLLFGQHLELLGAVSSSFEHCGPSSTR